VYSTCSLKKLAPVLRLMVHCPITTSGGLANSSGPRFMHLSPHTKSTRRTPRRETLVPPFFLKREPSNNGTSRRYRDEHVPSGRGGLKLDNPSPVPRGGNPQRSAIGNQPLSPVPKELLYILSRGFRLFPAFHVAPLDGDSNSVPFCESFEPSGGVFSHPLSLRLRYFFISPRLRSGHCKPF